LKGVRVRVFFGCLREGGKSGGGEVMDF